MYAKQKSAVNFFSPLFTEARRFSSAIIILINWPLIWWSSDIPPWHMWMCSNLQSRSLIIQNSPPDRPYMTVTMYIVFLSINLNISIPIGHAHLWLYHPALRFWSQWSAQVIYRHKYRYQHLGLCQKRLYEACGGLGFSSSTDMAVLNRQPVAIE